MPLQDPFVMRLSRRQSVDLLFNGAMNILVFRLAKSERPLYENTITFTTGQKCD